jgi:hypothetical protein
MQTIMNISKNTQNWNQYPAGTGFAMVAEKDFGILRGSNSVS